MYDPEALEAIHKAAERLNTNLEELHKHSAANSHPDLWRRLSEATDDLRRATRMLEGCGRPPVPAGGTPPGVVIVGSGNTQTTQRERIVGASQGTFGARQCRTQRRPASRVARRRQRSGRS